MWKMLRLRYLTSNSFHAVRSLLRLQRAPIPTNVPIRCSHDHLGPPQPFDNLPFKVHSRYTLTIVFGVMFGLGLWAPFLIVWYSMAKRTL